MQETHLESSREMLLSGEATGQQVTCMTSRGHGPNTLLVEGLQG